ncbi:MAG: IS1595 family transposase [Bacteroidales bacterium]
MSFMSFSKKGLSAMELQRQMVHTRYRTVWSMMHRIRAAMGKHDNLNEPEGKVEFDEGYFATETDEKERQNLKRGRGSQRKTNVAEMAVLTPLEDLDTGKVESYVGYFKLKALESHKVTGVLETIRKSLARQYMVFSDKSSIYVDN